MSDKSSFSDEDIKVVVESLGDQIGARPNENQYILTHILTQLHEGAKLLRRSLNFLLLKVTKSSLSLKLIKS